MKTTAKKRKYMAGYEDTPEEIKKREERNRARYQAEKKGLVSKGDNKQVDHKKMLVEGGSGDIANTRVVSTKTNEGWRNEHPGAYGKGKKK